MQTLRISEVMALYALYGWYNELSVVKNVRLALLNAPVGTAFFSSDGSDITTTVPKDWLTGTRIRLEFVGSGTPGAIVPLTTTTDYWLIRQSSTSFRLASTFANAIGLTSMTIPTIGTGYQLRVQKVREWSGAELARWEVIHAAYPARFVLPPLSQLPPTVFNSGVMSLQIIRETIENTTGIPLTYNTIALWENGTLVPGNTAGNGLSVTMLETTVGANVLPSSVTIDALRSRRITYSLTQKYDI
jgi:hypothetical protein